MEVINNNPPLKETLKSVGRGLWFGIIGLVGVALTALATSGAISEVIVTFAGMSVDLSLVILAAIGFVAKSVDRYVHLNDKYDTNGIAPSFLQG